MKRLLDVNTRIALTVERHPHHAAARKWYDEVPLTRGDLVFCLATELAFVRLVTQAAVMNLCGVAPATNAEAAEFLSKAYNDPVVSRVAEPSGAWQLWLKLADRPDASPHVWMDAYLAAFAITLGAELVTFDRGFQAYEKAGLTLRLLECP